VNISPRPSQAIPAIRAHEPTTILKSGFSFGRRQHPKPIATQRTLSRMKESEAKATIERHALLVGPKFPKRTMSDLSDPEVQRPRLWHLGDPLRPENFSAYSTNQSIQTTSQSDSDDGPIRGPGDIYRTLEVDEAEKMRLFALTGHWKGRVRSLFS
jgi:hypothetical protein